MGLDVHFYKVQRVYSPDPRERYGLEVNQVRVASEILYFRKMWSIVSFFQVENCEYYRIEKYILEELLSRCERIMSGKVDNPESLIPDIGTYIFLDDDKTLKEQEIEEASIIYDKLHELLVNVNWTTECLYLLADW